MKVGINFICYQLTWIAVVSNAGHQRPWAAAAAGLIFVALYLAVSSQRALDLSLLMLGALLGLVIDGSVSLLGWVRYASAAVAIPPGGAPLWILALWMAFSLTMTRSLAWLPPHPWWGALLGAIGAPLAYLSAERGWAAVRLVPPGARGAIGLALGWGVALAAFSYVIRCWPARAEPGAAGAAR